MNWPAEAESKASFDKVSGIVKVGRQPLRNDWNVVEINGFYA
jgi:hypothetical protein